MFCLLKKAGLTRRNNYSTPFILFFFFFVSCISSFSSLRRSRDPSRPLLIQRRQDHPGCVSHSFVDPRGWGLGFSLSYIGMCGFKCVNGVWEVGGTPPPNFPGWYRYPCVIPVLRDTRYYHYEQKLKKRYWRNFRYLIQRLRTLYVDNLAVLNLLCNLGMLISLHKGESGSIFLL